LICKSNRISLSLNKNAQKTDAAANMLKNNIIAAIFSGLICFTALLITFILIGNQFENNALSGDYINFFTTCTVIFIVEIILFVICARISSVQFFKSK